MRKFSGKPTSDSDSARRNTSKNIPPKFFPQVFWGAKFLSKIFQTLWGFGWGLGHHSTTFGPTLVNTQYPWHPSVPGGILSHQTCIWNCWLCHLSSAKCFRRNIIDISRTQIVLAMMASDSNLAHQNMLKYTFRGFFYKKPWCYAGTASV